MSLHPVLMPCCDPEHTPLTLNWWWVEVGDVVAPGDPLLELEGAKIAFQLESFVAGRVVQRLVGVGQCVPPYTLLAQIELEDD